jgi:hypothetical protein
MAQPTKEREAVYPPGDEDVEQVVRDTMAALIRQKEATLKRFRTAKDGDR